MKKGLNNKLVSIVISISFIILTLTLISSNITWRATDGSTMGPSAEVQACMQSCTTVNCDINNMTCRQAEGPGCQIQCNAQKPEQTADEICVEECASQGCETFDFNCQEKNKEVCDKECGMVKEPEAKSEEEQCIKDCVAKVDSSIQCQAAEGGEKGNEVCQQCAKSCEYLYAGPCISDSEIRSKQAVCNQNCEHCYGKPVMGDSGEGYECIVDIECGDATSEFGDNPGIGEGITKAVGGAIDAVGNAFSAIGDFFQNLFTSEEPIANVEPTESSSKSISSEQ